MPEIKLKYFRTGECVGIGQTTVLYLESRKLSKVYRLRLWLFYSKAKIVHMCLSERNLAKSAFAHFLLLLLFPENGLARNKKSPFGSLR